jgi:hypothetical protein
VHYRVTAAVVTWILVAGSTRAAAAVSACEEGGHGPRIVAISGGRFPSLRGRSSAELRAWAWHGGERRAVPFQIDECDAEGRVVIGTADVPPSAARLGPGAVVLLRSADGADPAPVDAAPTDSVAIEIGEHHSPRWIYFGHAESLGPSSEDEVDYDPGADRVQALRYTLAFEGPRIGYFAVADGKGRDRGNLIDRLKARVTARVLWGLLTFRRNEDEVKERVLGYRNGPLRVTRRAHLEVEIGWGLPAPQFIAEDYFYADHAEGPVTISLPFSLAYVFGDLDVRIFLDFRNLDGFELLAEALGRRAIPVGEGRTVVDASDAPNTWFVLRKGEIAFLHRLRLGPGLDRVESRLYYVYDSQLSDPPESVRGERPAVGYRMTRWNTVSRGRYDIWMDTYILDGASAADPRSALRSLSAAPRVTVWPTVGAVREP